MAQMKLIPADNMKDKLWGKRGTPEREAMETKLKEDVNAYIVGEAIRKARLAQNLTQEQLGERIGVQRAQISKLEKGTSVITLPTMSHTRLILTIILCLMLPNAVSKGQTTQTDTISQYRANYYGACIIRDGEAHGTRMDEPFAMHSVMKFPQALYAAEYMKRHSIALNDTIIVRKRQLMQDTWSPMLKLLDDGMEVFTYAELLQLSLAQSDNNACDLLFDCLGGPEDVETYIHQIGFTDIHIRHNEREMGIDHTLSLENCATPRALAGLFAWLYEHKNADKYLEFVWQAMTNCTTGTERLPAVATQGATLVHKTGTGYRNIDNTQYRNDAGIIVMPNGTWCAIAVFAPHAKEETEVAQIARELIGEN